MSMGGGKRVGRGERRSCSGTARLSDALNCLFFFSLVLFSISLFLFSRVFIYLVVKIGGSYHLGSIY